MFGPSSLKLILPAFFLLFSCNGIAQSIGKEYDAIPQLIAEGKLNEARSILTERQAECLQDSCLAHINIYFAKIAAKNSEKEKAVKFLEEAYQLVKNQYGESSIETAKISFTVGDVLNHQLYLFEDAIEYYNVALSFYEHQSVKDSTALYEVISEIGLAHVFEGEFELAEEKHKQALEIILSLAEVDPFLIHDAYSKLGGLYTKTIEYDLAEQNLLKAIDVWEDGNIPDSLVEIAETYRQLSYVISGKGYYTEAATHGKKALEILERKFGPNSAKLIKPCLDISWCYELQGEFEEALQFTGRALALVKMHYNPNHYYMASALSALGHIYFKMHRNEEAVDYYIQVLQIDSVDNPSLDQPVVAVDFHRLGLAYKALDRSREALVMINKTLEIQSKRFGAESLRIINTINNIGAVYSDLKLYDSARYFFRKALHICEVNEEKSILDLINIHKNMTETYNRESKFDLALEEINTSLTFLDIKTGPKGELIIPEFEFIRFKENLMYILRNRSTSLLGLYNEEGTTDKLLLAYENHLLHRKIYEYSIANSVGKGSQLFQASAIAQSHEEAIYILYELYRKTGENHYMDEAWELSEKSKAILLSRTINDKKIKKIAGIPEDLIEEETRLKKELSTYYVEYANLNFEIKNNEDSSFIAYQQEFYKLKSNYESFMLDLQQKYPAYYELTHFEQNISKDQIQHSLQPNNEAIVEYVEGVDQMYAFVMTNNDFHFITISGKDSLETAAKNMRAGMLENDFTGYTENAFYLYQKYFQPIEFVLKASTIENVVIVPDNYIGFIPFDALIKKDIAEDATYNDLNYLVYNYNLFYAYSASLKFQSEILKNESKDNLVAFAPAFSEQPSGVRTTRNAQTMTSLPFAAKEAKTISELFDGTELIGIDASENNFKNHAAHYSVIHLATHAVMDDDNPEMSRLYFHPSSDSIEDNILHAYEIYNMQLNADLIALSACNTGTGKIYKGEGIASLGRAFMYAGCPNILLSLWAVSDKSTSEIMTSFYEELKNGVPKSRALKSAKLAYLNNADKNTADPFYWAAFTIIGNSAPLKTTTKSYWEYALILSGLLVIGGGIYYKTKK